MNFRPFLSFSTPLESHYKKLFISSWLELASLQQVQQFHTFALIVYSKNLSKNNDQMRI